MPSTTRREVPHAGSELETLDALLQYCQETLLVKINGLSDDDLRRPQVPDRFGRLRLLFRDDRLSQHAAPNRLYRPLHSAAGRGERAGHHRHRY